MINTVTICNKMKTEHLQKPRKIDHEVIQNTQQEVSRLPIQSKSTIPEIWKEVKVNEKNNDW